MAIERIDVPEFHRRCKAQGVPAREDIAFVCPICRTVQSARTLIASGAGETMDEVEKFLGFSCVGRCTNAGPAPRPLPPEAERRGCDWTLGGLFQLHELEVTDADHFVWKRFQFATPEQAQALAARDGRLAEVAH